MVKTLQGDIQQLDIETGPEAAYEHCTTYVPNCDKPFYIRENTTYSYESTNYEIGLEYAESEDQAYFQFKNGSMNETTVNTFQPDQASRL